MLQTRNLSFAYAGGALLRFPDLDCAAGEQWLLLGSSGSGKTTMLHLLAGLRKPKQGEVRIGKTVLTKLTGKALDQFRGQRIGLVFQQPHFLRALTVGENLALARQMAGLPADPAAIRQKLERLNIGSKLHAYPHELSVGERQRAAVARALINEPSILLADEPTSALDDENATQVIALLREQATQAGATLLIVTHDTRLKTVFDQQIEL
ncbi:MAG: ABC transporter ATP-binding protein [Bacteroidetes bacterium]|nr:MAG: ABC transporter ATP-binding protein [Bacteroidota bacterium]